jgi:septal ring factor EnvC (AmiA/AmiB activator)
MREFLILACVVGFFAAVVFLGRFAGDATAGVDAQVQIGQLKAEAEGARAEAATLRESLGQCQEQLKLAEARLKKEQEESERLRKKVEDLEKR